MKAAIELNDSKYWLQRAIENLHVAQGQPFDVAEKLDRVNLLKQTVTLLLMTIDQDTPNG